MKSLEEQLAEARETNRKLNRRCQKLEQRINRWESRQYTLARWKTWTAQWWRSEMRRADALALENKKLKEQLKPGLISRLLSKIFR